MRERDVVGAPARSAERERRRREQTGGGHEHGATEACEKSPPDH